MLAHCRCSCIHASPVADGKTAAKEYDCKYIEVSAAIDHKIDELLVGILKQIRLIRQVGEGRRRASEPARLKHVARDTSCCPLKAKQSVLRLLCGDRGARSCKNLYVLWRGETPVWRRRLAPGRARTSTCCDGERHRCDAGDWRQVVQEPLRVVTGRDTGVTQETGARSCKNLYVLWRGETSVWRGRLAPGRARTSTCCEGGRHRCDAGDWLQVVQEPLRVVTGRDIGVTQETGARSCKNLYVLWRGETSVWRRRLAPGRARTSTCCDGERHRCDAGDWRQVVQEPLRVVTGRDIGVTQETGARSCKNLYVLWRGETYVWRRRMAPGRARISTCSDGERHRCDAGDWRQVVQEPLRVVTGRDTGVTQENGARSCKNLYVLWRGETSVWRRRLAPGRARTSMWCDGERHRCDAGDWRQVVQESLCGVTGRDTGVTQENGARSCKNLYVLWRGETYVWRRRLAPGRARTSTCYDGERHRCDAGDWRQVVQERLRVVTGRDICVTQETGARSCKNLYVLWRGETPVWRGRLAPGRARISTCSDGERHRCDAGDWRQVVQEPLRVVKGGDTGVTQETGSRSCKNLYVLWRGETSVWRRRLAPGRAWISVKD